MLETITMVKERYGMDHDASAVDVLHITFMTRATGERQVLSVNYADLSGGEKTTIDNLKTLINSKLNQSL